MTSLFANKERSKARQSERRAPRRHQLQDAKLVYVENQSGAIIDCRLKDISEFGAGVEIPNTRDVPAHVILKLADGTLYDAEVVWRTDHRLGLRFAALQRRRAPRRRQLKSGRLLINNPGAPIDCRIRDISKHGAGLECESATHVPTNVILKTGEGKLYEGEVAWQADRHLGLRFNDQQQLNTLVDQLLDLQKRVQEDVDVATSIAEKYQSRGYSTQNHPRLSTQLHRLSELGDQYRDALDSLLSEFGPD